MRKVFVLAVVALTIFWSLGLAGLAPVAQAATLASGDLIKASLPAVYYYGADAKRYVFPDLKTYQTWYSDFSTVKIIPDTQLATISIGGNVTYRPGVSMIKINTDPRVYAVAKGGVLRWIKNETVATCIYGSGWASQVNDVSDAFFVNYTTGFEIDDCSDYGKEAAMASATTINIDKSLLPAPTETGISATLAADNPAGATLFAGAIGVEVFKFKLSGSGTVTSLTFKAEGSGSPANIAKAYLYEGNNKLNTGQAFDATSKETIFNVNLPLSDRVLSLIIDISGSAVIGNTHVFKLTAVNGQSISPVPSNTFTIGNQPIDFGGNINLPLGLGISADTSNIDYRERLVQMGTSDNKALRVKASANAESFKITDLRATVKGNALQNVNAVKITYPTDFSQTLFASKTAPIVNVGGAYGYTADFSGLNWYAPNGLDSYASMEVTIKTATSGAVSGPAADFRLQLEVDNTDMGPSLPGAVSKALGLSSGTYVPNNLGADAVGNSLHTRKTLITVSSTGSLGSTGGSAVSGTDYWLDISVSNSSGSEAKIYALTLQLSSSDKAGLDWICSLPDLDLVTPGNQQIQLKDKDNISSGLVALTVGAGACSGGLGADTETYLVTFLNPLTISQGATKIYRVEINTASANTANPPGADTFKVSLVATDTQATVPALAAFQWNDGLGAGVANNNGWKVESLPVSGPSWSF